MPLLDHFRPPLFPHRHWESFHVTWAGVIAATLNEELLPDGFFAEEHVHAGARVEIDVATYQESDSANTNSGPGGVATQTWAPPVPKMVIPAAFPDEFEVRIFEAEGGARLVAAVELVSPANKDRAAHRRAFANKCAGYLAQGISLIVVDIVTARAANLHNELMAVLGHVDSFHLAADTHLYAVAYRAVVRDETDQIEVWPERLAIGNSLPTIPLALNAEICLPLDLESTYAAACQRKRL
jgi:hypothetical protein